MALKLRIAGAIQTKYSAHNKYVTAKKSIDRNSKDFDELESVLYTDYLEELDDFFRYMRLFFKSEDFSYEREYRIVVLMEHKTDKKIFFTRKGVIVPAVDIEFKSFPCEEVIILPTIEENISELGLKKLFDDKKSFIKITKSNIKVR